MTLTDEQKAVVAQWAAEGATLPEIHKRMNSDFGLKMTYLDARMLVSELSVSLDPKKEETQEAELDETDADEDLEDVLDSGSHGELRLTVDSIAKPNAMISGKVVFSDGEAAEWYIDTMGRLGINANTPGHRPSEADLMAFQRQLQEVLRKEGF